MEIYCVYCGRKFTPSPFFLEHARFCSIKCRNDYQAYVVDGKTPPPEKSSEKSSEIQPKKRLCEHCGAEFIPTSFNQKYCSEQCRTKHNNELHKKVKQCDVCGKDFTVSKHKGAQTSCDDCRDYIKNYRPSIENKPAPEPPKKSTDKTLDDWAREADEVGMTYGKYRVAVEKLGKTYDELKTEYERRKEGA